MSDHRDALAARAGRWAGPAQDNRRFLNGTPYVLRAGCPWRDMHERYRDRDRVERMFNRLKQFHRIATRYDKTALTASPVNGA